jgi:uracil-DNA glycosylase family 4
MHKDAPDSSHLRRRVIQRLESLQRAGVTHLPKPRRAIAVNVASTYSAIPTSHAPLTTSAGAPTAANRSLFTPDRLLAEPTSAAARPAALENIRQEVAGCTRCSELACLRTQTVFGVGSIQPRLVFVGEAPGADEDQQGEPFVGRAGQLLTRIIEACTLRREDVYIANVLKCRPPDNRPPLPEEIANCRGYLERQLEVLRPEFICCLGVTAAQTLLGSTLSIGKLRGRFHDYGGIPVLCTYHPSYLLRNPAAKRDVWEDMQVLMRRMGIEVKKD